MGIHKANIVSILALSVSACGDDGCGNRLIAVRLSPDSKLAAYHYVRDCGATTGFASVVALSNSGSFSDAQPVFVADDDHGKALLDTNGVVWTEVTWTGPRTVSIAYARDARVFENAPEALGVQLSYRATMPMVQPAVP